MPDARSQSKPTAQESGRRFDPARLSPASQRAFAALYFVEDGWHLRTELAKEIASATGVSQRWIANMLGWATRRGALRRYYERGTDRRRRVVLRVERRRLEQEWPDFDWRRFPAVWLDLVAVAPLDDEVA